MKPLIFRSEGDKFDAILDVPDESGAAVFSYCYEMTVCQGGKSAKIYLS